jgi:hypothetical protein
MAERPEVSGLLEPVTANKLPSVKNADGQQLAHVYYESVRSDDADFHLSSNFH